MIDTNELRRLAQAALVAPDGLSVEWMDRLGQFQESVSPAVISELLDRLEAAEQAVQDCLRIDREKAQIAQQLEAVDRAWKESDKSCRDLTEKVIPNIREQLESAERERDDVAQQLVQAEIGKRKLEAECDELRAKIDAMDEAMESLLIRCDDSDSAMYGTLSTSFVRDTIRIARAALEESK